MENEIFVSWSDRKQEGWNIGKGKRTVWNIHRFELELELVVDFINLVLWNLLILFIIIFISSPTFPPTSPFNSFSISSILTFDLDKIKGLLRDEFNIEEEVEGSIEIIEVESPCKCIDFEVLFVSLKGVDGRIGGI